MDNDSSRTTDSCRSRFLVKGMDCASCAAKVHAAVLRVPGIDQASVSATTGKLTVIHASDADLLHQLKSHLAPLGYDVSIDASAPTQRIRSKISHASEDDHVGDHVGDHADDHADHVADHVGDHADDHVGDHAHDACSQAHTHDDSANDSPNDSAWWASRKGKHLIITGAALLLSYLVIRCVPTVERWAVLPALLVGLIPIAWRAIGGIRLRIPFSMETLLTISAIGAVAIGAAQEAAMVVFLFLVGEQLEGLAVRRARAGIMGLAALLPRKAIVLRDGHPVEFDAEDLALGDVILVRPGDKIAADGTIMQGQGAVDEAPITGESVPKEKGSGDRVFAGTINGQSVLHVRVDATSRDNTIARVVRLVEQAQESKAPTERFMERFARHYTPWVVVVGAVVACVPPLVFGMDWVSWIYKGLAVLLIGCPCALVISTPAAIAAALSTGSRTGLLFKGGAVLEKIGKCTMIAFDKTGTLTLGAPFVTDVIAFDRSEAEVLAMAAAIERGSSHPFAKAIVQRAEADGVRVAQADEVQALPGKGMVGNVEGEHLVLLSDRAYRERAEIEPEHAKIIAELEADGKTVSVVVAGDKCSGLIAMRDEPREDAALALAELHSEGISTVMLSGDNDRAAKAIGQTLGIDVYAELLPQDKLRIVKEAQATGECVVVVGDGINDAPALAAADVGIAMGGSTDVALETADAAVLHGRVMDVTRMVRISRAAMANIKQNVAIALGLKGVFLLTTIAGVTGLWPAILADTGATVLVTMNALRLLLPSKSWPVRWD